MDYDLPPIGASDKALNEHLTKIVLLWIREFRFTSPYVVSVLTDYPMPYGSSLHRFMQRLIKGGLVSTFYNHRYRSLGMMFRLGPEAAGWFELRGLPDDKCYVSPSTLENSRTALHDLNVQLAALHNDRVFCKRIIVGRKRVPRPDEKFLVTSIESEAQLQRRAGGLPQPDLILRTGRRAMAYEYEMTRKTKPRIYYAFTNHLRAIAEGHYAGVCYMFPTAKLRDSYERLYMERLWPTTTRYSNGDVSSHGEPFNPDSIYPRGNPQEPGDKAIQFTVEYYLMHKTVG